MSSDPLSVNHWPGGTAGLLWRRAELYIGTVYSIQAQVPRLPKPKL